MQFRKQQLELDMEQQTGFKPGKEYIKAVNCHPAYLTYMQSTSCEMPGWMKHKLESRLPGEISEPQICRWHYPYGRKQRRTKEPLDESERGEWKSWLKTQHSENKIMASSAITSRQIDGETVETGRDFIFLGSKITADGDCSLENKRCLLLGRKVTTNLDSILKSRDINFAIKGASSHSGGFPSSHVWMWELDHKEGWAPKNWCYWAVVLEKTLESPLDCKELQPVHPKGNQSLIFIGRNDAKAEAPLLWPPDAKNWLIGKDPDAVKDWRQEEKGTTEGEMVGWHHQLDRHVIE